MSKRLILVLALAFVVGIAFAAYAEVQNVKISGDLTVKAVGRNNLDLAKTPTGAGEISSTPITYQDKESDMLSITRIRLDADLTDNVATTVRLLNERNWNGDAATGTGVENNRNIGLTTANTNVDENDIDLDLAYVTLKEFLYSPLTLTVGRQELFFGNGWIVGDPDTNGVAMASGLAEGDLSARKSFDAIRANLNYDPLVVDLIYAKVSEANTVVNDDVTLMGINANYALSKDTTLEGFIFSKVKGSNAAAAANIDAGETGVNAGTIGFTDLQTNKKAADQVHTVGARVVNKSVKNLSLDGQAAYQFGTYNPRFDPNAKYDLAAGGLKGRNAELSKRGAWGLEAIATYDLVDIAKISKYSPSISGMYAYLSGEDRNKVGSNLYRGWNPMFEDQTAGHLINAIMGFSNIHLGSLNLKAKPVEDVSLSLDYVMAWFAKRYPQGANAVLSGASTGRQFRMGKERYVGTELDMTLSYDYTEDVQFSLLGGVFMPGKSINEGDMTAGVSNGRNRAAATELIGSMKVTF